MPIGSNKCVEKRFHTIKEIFDLLSNAKQIVQKIPQGDKSFTYFFLDLRSLHARSDGRLTYPDDCGVYNNPSGKTFHFEPNMKKLIYLKEGQYYLSKTFDESQKLKDSANVLTVKTLIYKHKDMDFKKKVTKFSNFNHCLVEYIGQYDFMKQVKVRNDLKTVQLIKENQQQSVRELKNVFRQILIPK